MGSFVIAVVGPLGTWELILIGGIVLLLFGTRLPKIARSLGSSVVEFKRGVGEAQGLKEQVEKEVMDAVRLDENAGKPERERDAGGSIVT